MNFKELNTLLSSKAFDLGALLLPGGKRQGKEFVAGSIEGEKGQSLHVTIEGPKAGRWKDFATDEGGDMIALIERSKGLSPIQAANWARSWLGLPEWTPDNNTPPPFNPLTMGFKNRNESEWRKGSAAWTYHDENGVPVAWVVRFDTPGGGKSVMPIRIVDGKHRWKGYTGTEKRPLYNLHKLHSRPGAPVLIVEGEKTADAAAQLFPGYVVTTWMGGAVNKNKADWSPLLERKTPIVLWADADKEGRKAMAYIAQLIDGSKRVKTVDLPEKWDLADPVPDGVDINAKIDKALATDPDAEKRAKAAAEQEEQEGEVAYRLPHRCELSKVEHHILKYGVFEFNGQVYTMYDGRGNKGKWATEVSNFTVKIHQHITTKDGPLALITVNNGIDPSTTTDVSFDIFSTELAFKKGVRSFTGGNYQWYGTGITFEHYIRYLMDNMGSGRIITELGGQPEGFFVFNNAMVNGSVNMLSEHGTFQHGKSHYYVPSANKYYKDKEGEFGLQKLLIYQADSTVTFGEWQRQMRKVHRKHAYMASCYAVATAFSGYIFSRLRHFPIMFYYGPAGSGKDQLIQSAQALSGTPQPEISLTNPNTDKGMIKMFDEFADIILNLAEYKPRMKKDMNELLKNLWGRIGYRMAAMRGKRTEMIGIRCAAMISGNYYPSGNDALLTRLLVEVMDEVTRSPQADREYQKLRDMIEEGYSNLLADVLKHRKEFIDTWHEEHYRPARAILMQALGDVQVDSRIPSNMQILIGTYTFFRDKLEWGFSLDELLAHMVECMARQQASRSEGNEVSTFWTCFVHAVTCGRLKKDVHFKIDKDQDIIKFWWNEIYGAYAWAAKDMSMMPDQIVDSTSLKGKLQNHPCWIGPKDSTYIGKRKSSAYQFRMSETGTSLYRLVDTDSKFDEEPVLDEMPW